MDSEAMFLVGCRLPSCLAAEEGDVLRQFSAGRYANFNIIDWPFHYRSLAYLIRAMPVSFTLSFLTLQNGKDCMRKRGLSRLVERRRGIGQGVVKVIREGREIEEGVQEGEVVTVTVVGGLSCIMRYACQSHFCVYVYIRVWCSCCMQYNVLCALSFAFKRCSYAVIYIM